MPSLILLSRLTRLLTATLVATLHLTPAAAGRDQVLIAGGIGIGNPTPTPPTSALPIPGAPSPTATQTAGSVLEFAGIGGSPSPTRPNAPTSVVVGRALSQGVGGGSKPQPTPRTGAPTAQGTGGRPAPTPPIAVAPVQVGHALGSGAGTGGNPEPTPPSVASSVSVGPGINPAPTRPAPGAALRSHPVLGIWAGTGVSPVPTRPHCIQPPASRSTRHSAARAPSPVLLAVASGGAWAWRVRASDGTVIDQGVTSDSGIDVLFGGEPGLRLDVPAAGAVGIPLDGAASVVLRGHR